MPLEKSTPDPTSTDAPIPAAHARITGVALDFFGQTITVTLLVWRSQAAFAAGKQPLRSETYTIYPQAGKTGQGGVTPTFAEVLAANTAALNNLRQYFYTLLKTFPEWGGATEV